MKQKTPAQSSTTLTYTSGGATTLWMTHTSGGATRWMYSNFRRHRLLTRAKLPPTLLHSLWQGATHLGIATVPRGTYDKFPNTDTLSYTCTRKITKHNTRSNQGLPHSLARHRRLSQGVGSAEPVKHGPHYNNICTYTNYHSCHWR